MQKLYIIFMIICTHATRENCWLIQNKNNPFPNLPLSC
uniref:Uncharacterized protein n=1 Tax=Anguilla anguilla TaxID=7936 RepID=A0A0E9VMI2_ANGAN